MKKFSILICFLILALQSGCYGSAGISTSTITDVPTRQIETTKSVTDIPTQQLELTPSPLPTERQVPTYPQETRMKSQCLDVESMPIHDVGSSGVLILENRTFLDEGHYKPGAFQLDMKSGQMTEITAAGENQIEHIISPNRRLVAYEHVIYNAAGEVVRSELVVANAKGQSLTAVPWEQGWVETPAWLDNERLVINPSGLNPEESAGKKPVTLLVLNPFSGERQILRPDFPRFLDTPSTILPFWDGWAGVIYDPTLTRAIYPRFIGDNDEMYTYAVWDLSKRQLAVTLEDIFAAYSVFNIAYPMPKWSPDGSRFVFQNFIPTQDSVKMELYEVSREGQTRQLTQLSSVAYIWESTYSWSPDGRHIAMFLGPPLGAAFEKAYVAVLDTVTLNVTDYCVYTTFDGEGYGAGGPLWSPIWSPDGKQFLVTDWYEKDHRRVILVDIEKNIAVQIAQDMEPGVWMMSDP